MKKNNKKTHISEDASVVEEDSVGVGSAPVGEAECLGGDGVLDGEADLEDLLH